MICLGRFCLKSWFVPSKLSNSFFRRSVWKSVWANDLSDALETRETALYIRVTIHSNNTHLAKRKSGLKKNLQNFWHYSVRKNLFTPCSGAWKTESKWSQKLCTFLYEGHLCLLKDLQKFVFLTYTKPLKSYTNVSFLICMVHSRKKNPPPSVTLPPQRDIQGTWYRTIQA